LEAGDITGRVFFTNFGTLDLQNPAQKNTAATEAVVKGFSNLGTRSEIIDTFRAPLASALGVETEKVMITNILPNRDPLYGDGSKIGDGPVRGILSKTAPGLLRWVESTNAATDEDFWDTAMTKSIYKDTGPTKSKGDGKATEGDN
jgi:hypothetical protein